MKLSLLVRGEQGDHLTASAAANLVELVLALLAGQSGVVAERLELIVTGGADGAELRFLLGRQVQALQEVRAVLAMGRGGLA